MQWTSIALKICIYFRCVVFDRVDEHVIWSMAEGESKITHGQVDHQSLPYRNAEEISFRIVEYVDDDQKTDHRGDR